MWASWAFCELVHISMPTPYLSIKQIKNSTKSHHIVGQRAARQFGDEMQENSKINSIFLLIALFQHFSALSQPRLARVVKSFLARCVTPIHFAARNNAVHHTHSLSSEIHDSLQTCASVASWTKAASGAGCPNQPSRGLRLTGIADFAHGFRHHWRQKNNNGITF